MRMGCILLADILIRILRIVFFMKKDLAYFKLNTMDIAFTIAGLLHMS